MALTTHKGGLGTTELEPRGQLQASVLEPVLQQFMEMWLLKVMLQWWRWVK